MSHLKNVPISRAELQPGANGGHYFCFDADSGELLHGWTPIDPASNPPRIDYDQLAREYALHRRVQPDALRELISTPNLTPGSRVLEVGCGTGNYIHALREAIGCACWGIDPSLQMLQKARERAGGVQFKQGSAENLDFPTGSFDLVFSVDVIHHVTGRESYFNEAMRVLKPGGLVCTVTDSEEIIRKRQPLSTYFPETIPAELKRYPAIRDLRQMMTRSGFTELREVESSFPFARSDMQVFRDKAFSCLRLISEDAFNRGIQRMQADLQNGPIACVSYYLLLWGKKP